MPKFRKKPAVIEAVQYDGTCANVLDFLSESDLASVIFKPSDTIEGRRMLIRTLEGVMEASPGDWIIKGVKGEIYPVKPDIFAETYEPE